MMRSTTTLVTSSIQCVLSVCGGDRGGESEGYDFYCVNNQLCPAEECCSPAALNIHIYTELLMQHWAP